MADEFSEVFGTFRPEADEDGGKPLFEVTPLDERRAQHCAECGGLPSVHVADFKDKAAHPKNVYICCDRCSHCDGEWYGGVEEALEAWNEKNLGSPSRKTRLANGEPDDGLDFVDEMMKDFVIPA